MISTTSTDEGKPLDCAKETVGYRKIHLKIGQKIKIATWNVRSMSGLSRKYRLSSMNAKPTALRSWESKNTKRANKAIEGREVIYSEKGNPCQSGVTIYLNEKVEKSFTRHSPHIDRVLLAQLKVRSHNNTIIQVYAQTSAASKNDNFCDTFQNAINFSDKYDLKIMMGDFNAIVRRNSEETERRIVEDYGLSERNESGKRLIDSLSKTI